MPIINCNFEFSLKWYENCILSSSGTAANFTITDTKLYVPIVTLKIEDNTKLSKLLSEGLKDQFLGINMKIRLKTIIMNT